MEQARINFLRRFHTGGQPETMMSLSQADDAIQECLDTIEQQTKEIADLNTENLRVIEVNMALLKSSSEEDAKLDKVWSNRREEQGRIVELEQERDAALARGRAVEG